MVMGVLMVKCSAALYGPARELYSAMLIGQWPFAADSVLHKYHIDYDLPFFLVCLRCQPLELRISLTHFVSLFAGLRCCCLFSSEFCFRSYSANNTDNVDDDEARLIFEGSLYEPPNKKWSG